MLAAPTVNITNLDTSQVEQLDNIEVFKQKVVVSCQNIFYALSKPFNSLKQVVIMEHLNRHDVSDVDPTELKPKLAKFANATFARLWDRSAMKASTTLTPMVGVSMPTELEGMMGYICMGVMGTELTQKACSTQSNLSYKPYHSHLRHPPPSQTRLVHKPGTRKVRTVTHTPVTDQPAHHTLSQSTTSLMCWETARLYR